MEESYRQRCIDGFQAYYDHHLASKTYSLSDLSPGEKLPPHNAKHSVYVLRIGRNAEISPDIRAIPNIRDRLGILYIGGHESDRQTLRYNALLTACYKAERAFAQNGRADNDRKHGHPVAGCLTTSLLQLGFKISECQIDLVDGGPLYNELEFLIGYQEKFHMLPPWNASRKGAPALVA